MSILAIDPGNELSAFVILSGSQLVEFGKVENQALLERLPYFAATADHLAIEMIASYGMPVGAEVFETVRWIGRFEQAWGSSVTLVYRREVKLHLCGVANAKDGNIRQALIDRFGPGREKAIGLKRSPGPLFGVSADVWSALAIAVTYSDSVRPGAVQSVVECVA